MAPWNGPNEQQNAAAAAGLTSLPLHPYDAHLMNFLAFSFSASFLGSRYGTPQHRQPVEPLKHSLRHERRNGYLHTRK